MEREREREREYEQLMKLQQFKFTYFAFSKFFPWQLQKLAWACEPWEHPLFGEIISNDSKLKDWKGNMDHHYASGQKSSMNM